MTRGALEELVRLDFMSLAARCRGHGRPIVFCHGNSCSSRAFRKQLTSTLAERYRLIAVDLPGHGDSAPADEPGETYTLPGYAAAIAGAAADLDASNALFVGWSLGGHVLVEAVRLLPDGAGFLIMGAPPVASFAEFTRAAFDNPALAPAFREDSTDDEVRALVALFVRAGAPVPELFFEDFRRTDKRARVVLNRSVVETRIQDEARVVAELQVPLAVVHGVQEAVVRREWFDTLETPSLWRGAVQEVHAAGHAPHWENPEVFNQPLDEFAADCLGEG